jgi:hypothetical protein
MTTSFYLGTNFWTYHGRIFVSDRSERTWIMVLAAWMLKLATLHMGGSKAYEKWGVPVATGFLMGYAISILMDGILSAVRFFIPF